MENTVELRWVVAVMRRWLWVIAVFTLLSAVIAFALTSRTPPVYTSTATLLIRSALGTAADDYNAYRVSEQLALTYGQMIEGKSVLEAVIARLGLEETPRALAEKIAVHPVPDTQLIRISAQSSDPKWAVLLADSVAEEFIAYVQGLQADRYSDFLSDVQEQMTEISIVMDETRLKIDALSGPRTGQQAAELANLESILAGYRSTYAMLLQNYTQMRLTAAQSEETVVIAEWAQVPEGPVQRGSLYTSIASVLGAVVGVGCAFVLEHLDDTVRTREDVGHMLGLATFGVIPRSAQVAEMPAMIDQPNSPVAEAFRILASNVWFSALDASLRAFLVTSPAPGEGKSFVVANLGVAMAQLGLRVVVLDADLHRPQIGRLFGLESDRQGFAAALVGEGSVDYLIQPTGVERLVVLGAAHPADMRSGLLNSDRVQIILEELKGQADMVLIDSPPALPVADTALLARRADGVLLVLQAGRTRREAVQRTMECLQHAKASLVGVVLNAVPARRYTREYPYRGYSRDEESRSMDASQREQRRAGRRHDLMDLMHDSPRVVAARMKVLGDTLTGYGSTLLMRLRGNGSESDEMDALSAARTDLPAIARARSLERLKEQLASEIGPSEEYNSSELDDLVGQRLAELTGWSVSGRAVRRYLALLSLPTNVQEFAEATGLREYQLRPLVGLDAPEQQFILAQRIVREKLSGADVEQLVRMLRYKNAVVN